jgi:hypothetical protein
MALSGGLDGLNAVVAGLFAATNNECRGYQHSRLLSVVHVIPVMFSVYSTRRTKNRVNS